MLGPVRCRVHPRTVLRVLVLTAVDGLGAGLVLRRLAHLSAQLLANLQLQSLHRVPQPLLQLDVPRVELVHLPFGRRERRPRAGPLILNLREQRVDRIHQPELILANLLHRHASERYSVHGPRHVTEHALRLGAARAARGVPVENTCPVPVGRNSSTPDAVESGAEFIREPRRPLRRGGVAGLLGRRVGRVLRRLAVPLRRAAFHLRLLLRRHPPERRL